jgi:hypothetical protein
MTDPEIRINILRAESELHIFIEQLANMTPHEVAVLVEDIAGILRTLPGKPLWQMSTDDPELVKDNSLSHDAGPWQHLLKHSWNLNAKRRVE